MYIKGIVVSIEEAYNTQYGNGSFTISDDGTAFNTFKVWRAYYLNNAKYQEGQPQVEVGDTVVVYGFVINYKGIRPRPFRARLTSTLSLVRALPRRLLVAARLPILKAMARSRIPSMLLLPMPMWLRSQPT